MDQQTCRTIVERALDELINKLEQSERRNKAWNEAGGFSSRLRSFASDDLRGEVYSWLLGTPQKSDSRLRKGVFRVYHCLLRGLWKENVEFRRLEACLWKQWVPEWHNIAFEHRIVAVPVIYGIAVDSRISPRWKFRILVQRFARRVFNQIPAPIGPRQCRERTAATEAISYVLSKVFGLESAPFSVWCIHHARMDADGIRGSRPFIEDFCCLLIAEMLNEEETALLQLCSEYGRSTSKPFSIDAMEREQEAIPVSQRVNE